jgi:hypothetical protein
MSFFSGLFSDRQQSPAEPSAAGELFNSANFRSTATPSASPAAGPSTQSSNGTVPDANLNANAPPTAPAPSALDTFSAAYDPSKLHPLAGLGDNLDFLQLEEDKLTDVHGAQSVLPSRGWTDDLCVGTGTTYLSGEHGDPSEGCFPSPIDHGLSAITNLLPLRSLSKLFYLTVIAQVSRSEACGASGRVSPDLSATTHRSSSA